jgi:hypothetical protein
MTEKILNKFENTLNEFRELLQYQDVLTKDLIDTAKRIITNEIPQNLNSILDLLNSVNGESAFRIDNDIDELKELFCTQKKNLDKLFKLAENNERIVGTNLNELFTAKQVLNSLINVFEANCQSIQLTLITAKIKKS